MLNQSKSMRRALQSLFVAIALSIFTPAAAAPISFAADARVFRVDNTLGQLNDFFPVVPQIDDVISLTLTFDPDTVGPPVPTSLLDTVFYNGGVPGSTITVGDVTLISNGGPGNEAILVTTSDVAVLGSGVFDGYGFTSGAAGPAGSDRRWGLNLAFVGGNLENLDPPDMIPFLDGFEGAGVGFRSFDTSIGGEPFDEFAAVLIDVRPVPIPGAVWLLGSGLGLLGFWRRRPCLDCIG
jgi:hypothetical protein